MKKSKRWTEAYNQICIHDGYAEYGVAKDKPLSEKPKESLLIHLFGDTPKSRILDYMIANKGQSFSKTEISRGANVFKTAFFKQNQKKHHYDYFGDLVRLGVVKPVNNGGRAPKYQIDIKVLKARLKEIVR